MVCEPFNDEHLRGHQLILAPQVARAVDRLIVDQDLDTAAAVGERDEHHLATPPSLLVFFFNDTATTEIYTLSLHDALPILTRWSASSANTTGGSGESRGP